MKLSVVLYNAAQGHTALVALWDQLKPLLIAGHKLHVTVQSQTRSLAQNRILHSCLADLSRQVDWAGRRQDIDVWKRLATAAWLRETGKATAIFPALDGQGVDVLYRRTSSLTVKECADLVTWLHAFGDMQGVKWSRTSLGADVPDEVFE